MKVSCIVEIDLKYDLQDEQHQSLIDNTEFSVFQWREPLSAIGDLSIIFTLRGFKGKGVKA
jgi:hypothetical protein